MLISLCFAHNFVAHHESKHNEKIQKHNVKIALKSKYKFQALFYFASYQVHCIMNKLKNKNTLQGSNVNGKEHIFPNFASKCELFECIQR